MNDSYVNFQTVLDAVYPRVDELVQHLIPRAKKSGGSYRCGDATGEKGSSFSISTTPNNAGSFIDHADPSVCGNAIGLWALIKNQEYQEAGNALAGFLGIAPEARMHMPKKRPVPKIKKEEGVYSFQCGKRTEAVLPLNHKSVAYAASRGITAETLKKTRCVSTDTHIVFPHFDDGNKPVLFKCWSCDGQKHMFSNDDPVPVLFGKHLIDPLKSGSILIICEGQWDAMTWIQLGFPAVSIPSGAGNHEWIGEDWAFLNCFSEIYIDYDDDSTGRDAEVKAKARLGIERCRSIHYRFKDANAALQAGEAHVLEEAFKHAKDAPIERIVRAEDMREKVRNRLNRTNMKGGTPFFLPSLNFEFRPHEITLWYGITSHGKSALLSNQICYAASLGKKAIVASFEQATDMTMAAMLSQYTSDQDIGQTTNYNEAYDSLNANVLFYDSMVRSNPKEMCGTIVMAHKQLGVEEAVIDNIMTLEVDRQDNTAQAAVADGFRVVAARYPLHLHLVAHPRKPPANDATKPPGIADIMGASEWSAMAHNVICVWRDVAKSQKLSEMRDENMDPILIMQFDQSIPDGKVFIRKQRDSGDLPMVSYFFNSATKRAWKNEEDQAPYFFPEEPSLEEQTPP